MFLYFGNFYKEKSCLCFMIGDKRAAIEMSVGTIVTIVLAMTMLIGGIMLVKNIFSGAGNIADITNEQALKQVTELYGEDKKVAVLPASDKYKFSVGETSSIRIVIQNLVKGKDSGSGTFSYEMSPLDLEDCGFSESEVYSWIIGEKEDGISIAPGENYQSVVAINIPDGTPFCTFRIRINTFYGSDSYEPTMIIVETVK